MIVMMKNACTENKNDAKILFAQVNAENLKIKKEFFFILLEIFKMRCIKNIKCEYIEALKNVSKDFGQQR